ncbi:MAG: hypothetical protein RJB66_2286 [Pseudomonadota bacterium]
MLKKLILAAALSLGFASTALGLTETQKLADFHQLTSLIEAQYGPKLYKQEHMGISLESLKKSYEEQITQTKTNGEFYYLMVRFVAEFKDGHFGVTVPTEKVSSLGFTTDYIDGKVLIDEVDKKALPNFEFQRGDEIVTLNKLPIEVELNAIKPYISNGNDLSITRIAAITLSRRRAARLPAPTGSVELGIRHGNSDIIDTVTLEWKQTGKGLDEEDGFFPKSLNKLTYGTNYSQISIKDLMADLKHPKLKSIRCSGETRIEIPQDATVLTMEPFVSYYHPTDKGNIGYLRIPHYHWEEAGESINAQIFAQYVYVIDQLEKNTVGLVIDQDHNCGGSVELVEQMASIFIPKTYPGLEFQLLASKTEYLQFKGWLREYPENTFDHVGTQEALDLILNSWKKGDYLTPKSTLHGSVPVRPYHYQYTKPIVLLTDEMSGSGGDAFPGLLQGHGRAKVIGNRTMGLGGHVEEVPALYNSGLNLRMTKSLFYRPDGVAIENNGVQPDVKYVPTRDDFMYGFKNYQKFYLNELFKLIEQK